MAGKFGTGVYFNEATGMWVAQLPKLSNGKRPSRSFVTGEEAAAWRTHEMARITLGLTPDVEAEGAVQEYVFAFMAQKVSQATTRRNREQVIKRFITDQPFGLMNLSAVRPMHINQVINLTPDNNTRVRFIDLLSVFFQHCSDNGFLQRNPFPPSNGPILRERYSRSYQRGPLAERTWSMEEVWYFFEHERNSLRRDLWLFMLATGVRPGEALGMQWPRIFLDELYCAVTCDVTTSGGLTVVENLPKGYKPRVAYMGPFLAKVLGERRTEQSAFRATLNRWDDREWVWDRRIWKPAYTMRPGEHLDPARIPAQFHAVSDLARLPRLTGPHGLRRTFAKLAEKEGFPESVRGALLGHKPNITAGYSMPTEAEKRDVAQWLDGELETLLTGRWTRS